MKKNLIILILTLITFNAVANNAIINWVDGMDSINLGKQVLILEDKENKYTIDELNSSEVNALFLPSNQNILNFHNPSYYWLKFTLNNTSEKPLILEFAQPIMKDVAFYYKDALTGKWEVIQSGYKVHLNNKLLKHPFQIFPLQKNSNEYYVRFQSFGLAIPVCIWDENLYEEKVNRQRIVFGIFSGLMLFVVLINLFFAISLRKLVYLLYSTLVLLYYFIAINIEGYMLYLFPNADLIYEFNHFSIIALPIGTLYAMFFLEVKKYSPTTYKFGWAMFIYYCSFNFWHIFLSPLQLIYVTDVSGLSNVLMMIFMAIQTGRRGNKMGYYFFTGYIIFFSIAIVDSISRLTGSPAIIFEISYISIAFLFEALIFSYLLTKKFDWEKRKAEHERLDTQALLIEKTFENEKMVREQNVILEKRVEERTQQLQKEKKKSDMLLLNILPADIADELKTKGTSKARSFENVSVLFSDFKDFTILSEEQDPEKMVFELDYCFRAFDKIIKKHKLEKIKTIGDAYMCAGGLPTKNDTHAMDVVRAGLEICDFMKQLQETRRLANETCFEVRVGISSGPVVAGIVGSDKFVYDIWGDTVNTAARMEQASEAGKVNISRSTYESIKNNFEILYRGKVEAKNKGLIDMYFVHSEIVES